eukprot:1998414-Amphidinium_carterae.1
MDVLGGRRMMSRTKGSDQTDQTGLTDQIRQIRSGKTQGSNQTNRSFGECKTPIHVIDFPNAEDSNLWTTLRALFCGHFSDKVYKTWEVFIVYPERLFPIKQGNSSFIVLASQKLFGEIYDED